MGNNNSTPVDASSKPIDTAVQSKEFNQSVAKLNSQLDNINYFNSKGTALPYSTQPYGEPLSESSRFIKFDCNGKEEKYAVNPCPNHACGPNCHCIPDYYDTASTSSFDSDNIIESVKGEPTVKSVIIIKSKTSDPLLSATSDGFYTDTMHGGAKDIVDSDDDNTTMTESDINDSDLEEVIDEQYSDTSDDSDDEKKNDNDIVDETDETEDEDEILEELDDEDSENGIFQTSDITTTDLLAMQSRIFESETDDDDDDDDSDDDTMTDRIRDAMDAMSRPKNVNQKSKHNNDMFDSEDGKILSMNSVNSDNKNKKKRNVKAKSFKLSSESDHYMSRPTKYSNKYKN